MRIPTTPRAHDLGYGFLLTRAFEHFGVELRKRVDAQVIDEVGAAQSWVVALPSSRRVIVGHIREHKHPVLLPLIVVEIKVFKHFQCLFRVPLQASQLLHQLLQIRDFGLIFPHCNMSSRRRKS